MQPLHRFTGSLLIAALTFSPLAALAAESQKGLNAVNVKTAGAAVIPLFGEQSTRRSIPENSIEFRVPVGGEGDSVEVRITTGNGNEINVIQKKK